MGVVGCGAISERYLETMTKEFGPLLNVVCCCSRGGTSAQTRAAQFGLEATDLEGLLRDPRVELVVNLTPAEAHAPIVARALAAGKHVYTEKTLATRTEDGRALVEEAKRRGLLLCCAPDTILSAGVQAAGKALSAGRIGAVTSCEMTMSRDYGLLYPTLPFLLRPGAGSGADIGPYFFATAVYLLGGLKRVAGLVDVSRPRREGYTVPNENRFMALLDFQSGVRGTFHLNADAGGPERPRIVLYGTAGTLELYAPNKFCKRVVLSLPGDGAGVELPMDGGCTELLRGIGVAEMARALRAGDVPRTDARAALHVLEAIEGVYESSRTGRCVSLTTAPPATYRYDGAFSLI